MESALFELGVVRTLSDRVMDVKHPDPASVSIEDIAHSLSMQCRYMGHVNRFYSVAEHSFLVSMLVGDEPETQLWALLHDAPEAYLGDMAAPVRELAELTTYRLLHSRVMVSVCAAFGLTAHIPHLVNQMDEVIRNNEMKLLCGNEEVGELAPVSIACWEPQVAEKMFLERFHSLYPLPTQRST